MNAFLPNISNLWYIRTNTDRNVEIHKRRLSARTDVKYKRSVHKKYSLVGFQATSIF